MYNMTTIFNITFKIQIFLHKPNKTQNLDEKKKLTQILSHLCLSLSQSCYQQQTHTHISVRLKQQHTFSFFLAFLISSADLATTDSSPTAADDKEEDVFFIKFASTLIGDKT